MAEVDEVRLELRTAAILHNVSVITRPGMFGSEMVKDLIDVEELLKRYDNGEPIKDLMP